MPEPLDEPLHELRERLLRAGVARRHVRRYLSELADHLADLKAEEECAGGSRSDAESAALVRLGGMDELANAMIERREFQSWCVRAPWAIFGLAPLFLLAGADFVACLVLWSGWKIFLPGTNTPFARIDGFAIFYFGVGRLIYYGAPILVGWVFALIAARQRINAIWPIVGLVLIALMSATAQVQASRPAPGGTEHISMGVELGHSVQAISSSLFHGLLIFSALVLPYLIWRLQKAPSLSA
ncbi:MAG: permease prefix domain 1-containing protein [Gemmatimonadota bacterium]|nr:permease prefix domain 1-containing protein [Gemmatimonadota bacterium]